MSTLQVNFLEVPDKILPVPPGIYEVLVITAPVLKPSKKGTGNNLMLEYKIITEGDFKGRALKDTIFLSEIGLMRVKKLLVSAKVELRASGVDTEELIGKTLKVLVKQEMYQEKDPATQENVGEARPVAKIEQYV